MEINLDKIKKKKTLKELLEFSILNIDKPTGPTSFKISEIICNKFGLRKTSHFGTLDPKVTGVLPIALNRACKLTGYFLGHDKEYVGIMRIHREIDKTKLQEVIQKKFVGRILQKPPVKSRVKRKEREREVREFIILEGDKDKKNFLFRCRVQGGTYIRKLVSDLGKELGCGAHMLELRRTAAGIFSEKDSVTLYTLEKALADERKLKELLIPAEIITKIYPAFQIRKESEKKLFTGKPAAKEDFETEPDLPERFVLFSGLKFIGIYKKAERKGFIALPEFVLQPLP